MKHPEIFVCPANGDRHIQASRPDYEQPFYDANEQLCYPMLILLNRCINCGYGLTSGLAYQPGSSSGRWARYIITEEPW